MAPPRPCFAGDCNRSAGAVLLLTPAAVPWLSAPRFSLWARGGGEARLGSGREPPLRCPLCHTRPGATSQPGFVRRRQPDAKGVG